MRNLQPFGKKNLIKIYNILGKNIWQKINRIRTEKAEKTKFARNFINLYKKAEN